MQPRPVPVESALKSYAKILTALACCAVFPVGARVIRGLVYREIPRQHQSVVLVAFAWFGVAEAILAYPPGA